MPKYIAKRVLVVTQTLELECASEGEAKSMGMHPVNSMRWTDKTVTHLGNSVDIEEKKEEVGA